MQPRSEVSDLPLCGSSATYSAFGCCGFTDNTRHGITSSFGGRLTVNISSCVAWLRFNPHKPRFDFEIRLSFFVCTSPIQINRRQNLWRQLWQTFHKVASERYRVPCCSQLSGKHILGRVAVIKSHLMLIGWHREPMNAAKVTWDPTFLHLPLEGAENLGETHTQVSLGSNVP